MRINNSGKNSIFNLFKRLGLLQKALVIAIMLLIASGVCAAAFALATGGEQGDTPAFSESNAQSDSDNILVDTSGADSSDAAASTAASDLAASTAASDLAASTAASDAAAASGAGTSTAASGTGTSTAASGTGTSKAQSGTGTSKAESGTGTSKAESGTGTSQAEAKPPKRPTDMPADYLDKYSKYYKNSPDLIGWIKLEGTNLNYPVVQGDDNTYYLNKNELKQKSPWGVPYMDCNVTCTKDYRSPNVILYGHSDDKRTLQLSATKGYRKIDFYKQHPTIEFDTLYEEGTYKVVAFFITNQNAQNWLQYHTFIDAPPAGMSFDEYIAAARARSYINTDIDVLSTDELLTIQTCEDTNAKNFNRLVMVARKVRQGEDASVDTSGATQNASQVLPK